MTEDLVFTKKTSGLVKGLSWFDVFLLVISAPAGSGILYYSVNTASTYPGANVGLSFFIGLLIILPIIILAAVSASIVPRSGSPYVLISRVISPEIGFLAAALFFLGYTLSIGVVAFVVTQVIGGVLVNTGLATGIEGLQNFGESLQTPIWCALGGTTLVLLTWAIVLNGIRVFRNIMRTLFVITLIAAAITVFTFFWVGENNISELFNSTWGSGTYNRVIDLAATNGWNSPDFSWDSTFNLLLVVLFSYAGLELICYASGEVSRNQGKAIKYYIVAAVSLAMIYITLSMSVTNAYGNFLGAYDFIFKNHIDKLQEIMPAISPSIPFYIASIMPNPWLGVLISLAISLWLVTTMIPYFFAPSRLIFALSMDRILPEKVSEVNDKGAPTVASHLTLVFALLGVFLNFWNVGTVLGTILFSAVFVYWLYGLAAMVLPYRNEELYASSPLQTNIAGIPLLSIIGATAFAVGWFVIFISAKQMSLDIVLALCVYMAIVMLYYVARVQRNRSANVDIQQIYNKLPPE